MQMARRRKKEINRKRSVRLRLAGVLLLPLLPAPAISNAVPRRPHDVIDDPIVTAGFGRIRAHSETIHMDGKR